jgi:tRNA nucleotidyltransferase (CCA-adding enzyme)
MSIKDAFRRRDLTINAMGVNAQNGILIDPFNGKKDLDEKVLRSPDLAFFVQDPLRFFRVMQFIARFDMEPDKELEELCKNMDLSGVSRERIEQEFAKMLLWSNRPSRGIRWLHNIDRLKDILPELADTVGIKQDQGWHPEGDVFEHSMQTLDAAAQLNCDDEQRLALYYAALCHDLGKVQTTTQDEKGPSTGLRTGIHSYGHAEAGERLVRTMLKRITHNQQLCDQVATLVRWHMVPMQLVESNSKLTAYKRLASKLAPYTNISMLAKLALADKRGRNPESHEPLVCTSPDVDTFIQRAEQARVTHKKEPALLTGKDFLDEVAPGPLLGRIVKKAYELQLEGVTNIQELKRLTLQEIKKDEEV